MLSSLRRIGFAQILAGSITLVVATILFAALALFQTNQQSGQFVEQLAASTDTQIRFILNRNTQAIEALARQPRVISLLTEPNLEKRLELENEFIGFFPHAQDFRLIKTGQRQVTADTTQNFADLAMIKAAENSPSPPPAAAIAYETDQAHITMIHRVIGDDGKRVIGTIMVQFKPALVAQALQDISLPHGYVELRQQKSSGGFTTLAATGEPSAKNANPVWTRPIEATRWQLAYWAGSQATTLPITLLTGFLLTGVVTLAGFILVTTLIQRKITKHVENDLQLLVKLGQDGLNNNLADNYNAVLKETKAPIEDLKKVLIAHQVKAAEQVRSVGDKNLTGLQLDEPSLQ